MHDPPYDNAQFQARKINLDPLFWEGHNMAVTLGQHPTTVAGGFIESVVYTTLPRVPIGAWTSRFVRFPIPNWVS